MCATCGCGADAPDHRPRLRRIQLEADVFAKNSLYARGNRKRLRAQGTLAVNLVSGPGAGKTELLARTLTDLSGRFSAFVVVGDQHTSRDAERLTTAGIAALQINT